MLRKPVIAPAHLRQLSALRKMNRRSLNRRIDTEVLGTRACRRQASAISMAGPRQSHRKPGYFRTREHQPESRMCRRPAFHSKGRACVAAEHSRSSRPTESSQSGDGAPQSEVVASRAAVAVDEGRTPKRRTASVASRFSSAVSTTPAVESSLSDASPTFGRTEWRGSVPPASGPPALRCLHAQRRGGA